MLHSWCQMSWSTLWLAGCGSPSACPSGGTRGRIHVYIRAHWSLLSSSGSRLLTGYEPCRPLGDLKGSRDRVPGGSRSARRCAPSFTSSSSIHAPREPAALLVHAAARTRPLCARPGHPRPLPAAADVPAVRSAALVHQRPEPPALSAQPSATSARVRKLSLTTRPRGEDAAAIANRGERVPLALPARTLTSPSSSSGPTDFVSLRAAPRAPPQTLVSLLRHTRDADRPL
jgi:hypothetical protein